MEFWKLLVFHYKYDRMQFYNILYPYETYFELYDTEYVHFLNSVHVVHCLCLVSLTRDVSDYAIW